MNLPVSTRSAFFFALLALAGCATQELAPQRQRVAMLHQAIGLQVDDDSGMRSEYVDIRGALVAAPAGASLMDGKLWLAGLPDDGAAYPNRRWIDLADVAGWSTPAGGYTVVTFRNGARMPLAALGVHWCSTGAAPQCYRGTALYGATVTMRALAPLAQESTELPLYGLGSDQALVTRTFTATEAGVRRNTLAAAFGRRQQLTLERELLRRREWQRKETEKTIRLDNAKPGTTIQCASTVLLDRTQLVEEYLRLSCSTIDSVLIYELKEAGWGVKVTDRVLTHGSAGVGDSIRISASKLQ